MNRISYKIQFRFVFDACFKRNALYEFGVTFPGCIVVDVASTGSIVAHCVNVLIYTI